MLTIQLLLALLAIGVLWIILCVLINPIAFLPYASACGAFVAFCVTQIAGISKVFSKTNTSILGKIMNKKEEKYDQIFKNILNTWEEEDKRDSETQIPSNVPLIVLDRLAKNSGFDIHVMIRMKDGKQSAFKQFGESEGINSEIVKAITGLATNNTIMLKQAITNICHCENLYISPHLSLLIIQMIFDPLSVNQKAVSKILSNRFIQYFGFLF
jgi:hypothetical protein